MKEVRFPYGKAEQTLHIEDERLQAVLVPKHMTFGAEKEEERCGLGGSPTKVKRTYTPELHKANVRIEGKGAEESVGTLLALLKDRKIL